MGPGRVRKTRVESKLLTNEHIDGIRFKPRQELSLEIDTLKVHIDSAENIKTVRGHDLLGGGVANGVAGLVGGEGDAREGSGGRDWSVRGLTKGLGAGGKGTRKRH